jgi:hypothetical protein
MVNQKGDSPYRFGRTLRERLFSRIIKQDDECWIWTGSKAESGHGHINVGKNKMMKTHRLSWIFLRGPIPDGLCVLHHCDVPACINPDHLYVGTVQNNVDDMWARGRQPKDYNHPPQDCENNPNALLSNKQVAEIKRMLLDGKRQVDVARMFGVSRFVIWSISKGRTWKDIVASKSAELLTSRNLTNEQLGVFRDDKEVSCD